VRPGSLALLQYDAERDHGISGRLKGGEGAVVSGSRPIAIGAFSTAYRLRWHGESPCAAFYRPDSGPLLGSAAPAKFDAKPSSNHADKPAKRVVTQGFPW